MTIKGKYSVDANFYTVYTNNRMYTISRNSDNWGSVGIGEMMANGYILDQETYDLWMSKCDSEGTFDLEEE